MPAPDKSVSNPKPHTQTAPIIIHRNDSIIYADQTVLSLFNIESRESLLNTGLLEHIAASDRHALAEQFNRVENGEALALGLRVTVASHDTQISDVIVVTSQVNWNGQGRLQTVLINTNSHLPSGLPAETMDTTPVGITIADANQPDLPLIYVNDEFVELTGYPREEVLGRNCRFLQGEKTRNEPVRKMRRAIENCEPVTVELRNYRKEGMMFWSRVSIQPVRNDADEVTHFFGYQEDISDRKAYQQEKTLFEMQAESLDKCVFITDFKGNIEYVNPQFEQTTGYTASEAIGNTPRLIKSDAQDGSFYQELWETITAGEIWESTITNKRKTGERYEVAQKIIPITNVDGEVTHFVCIEEDITDSQFVEEVLGVMNRVLRHNLRNSLTAIEGYAKRLERDENKESHQAALQAIQERASKLRQTSEKAKDIRALFRRRGEEQPVEVSQVFKFIDTIANDFPEANIECIIKTDAQQQIRNGSLLQVAIEEAIENAVVHNNQEQPVIEITITDCTNNDEIAIQISDNGPGIPPSEWDVIFDGKETPLIHGTGIGVWLMYWILRALGGKIELTDSGPNGSIITFFVPTITDK
jgi:PAS domain S-box-containing protein